MHAVHGPRGSQGTPVYGASAKDAGPKQLVLVSARAGTPCRVYQLLDTILPLLTPVKTGQAAVVEADIATQVHLLAV